MGGDVPYDIGGEQQKKTMGNNENVVRNAAPLTREEQFCEDPVLKYPRECINPRLRDVIEAEGRDLLHRAATLLEEHGTPDEVARRVALRQAQGGILQLPSLENIDGSCAIPPITPTFAAPSTAHATLHDADEELGRYCQFILTITSEIELYNVPCDVQRRIVPLLFLWVVDWDFLRRNLSVWEQVAECFCRVVRCRRKRFSLRPDFSLPWRPLVKILMSVFFQSGRVLELNDFHAMRKIAGKHFERVCEFAVLHFDADALEGLWETFAPYFSVEREEAPLMLCLFSHLIPIHRLVDDETGAPLPLTERIIKFLLDDSIYWQQQSKNWLSYSLKVVFKMSLHHVGLVNFDKYAEQLFSAILFQLRLPIAEGKKVPSPPSGFGVLSSISFFAIQKGEMCSAYGFIGSMLPRKTDSPLWNHLRRFILATSAFLNPTTANTKVVLNLFTFFGNLVAAVHRRMFKQEAFKQMRAKKTTFSKSYQIPEPYLWNSETVNTFVTLMAPVLLSFLHHRFDDAPRIVGLLASLAPEIVQPLIFPYVSVGLRGGVGSQAQRTAALLLLVKTLYPLSECRATRGECWRFLADLLPLLLPWVSPGEPKLLALVLDVVFATCTITKLAGLLGGQDAEREFAVTFVERVFECSGHVDIDKCNTFQNLIRCIDALCTNVSDETFEFCVSKAVKEAEVRGSLLKAQVVSFLLEPFARRATDRMMHWAARSLIPSLQSTSTALSEVQWCAHLLAGCVRGAGLASFSQRDELMRCIQCQASHFAEEDRLLAAATLYSAMYKAFTGAECVNVCATKTAEETVDKSAALNVDEAARESAQDEFKMSMEFCCSNVVKITWRETSEEHIIYLLNVYTRLVGDLLNFIRDIDNLLTSSNDTQNEAFKSFCNSAKHYGYFFSDSAKEGGNSDVNDSEEQRETKKRQTKTTIVFGADGSDSLTPRSVLRGVLLWLQLVLEINQELRAWWCSGTKTPSMVPWWMCASKLISSFLFPFSPESLLSSSSSSSSSSLLASTMPFMHENIHDFLVEHALQSVVGNLAEESSVAKALCLDCRYLPQNKQISGSSHAADMDLRGSRCVLSILAEQCNISLRNGVRYDQSCKCIMRPFLFKQYVAEPLRCRRYFPLMYWRLKAEYLFRFFRSLLMHTVSPKCLGGLINITHTLLFSPYRSLKLDCCHILFESIQLLGVDATRHFFARHIALLKRIAEFWGKEDDNSELTLNYNVSVSDHSPTVDDDCENKRFAEEPGGDELGADRVNTLNKNDNKTINNDDSDNIDNIDEGDGNNKNKENSKSGGLGGRTFVAGGKVTKQHMSQFKRELDAILPVFPIDISCLYFYQDYELIKRKYELLLYLPDKVFSKMAEGGFFSKSISELGPLTLRMGNTRTVLLCDELLVIASKCSVAMPDRAIFCLVMVVALYRPSRVALLSPQSVMILFRLTLNSHKRLRVISFHVLHALFLSLKELHPKSYILTRRGALEDAGNADFFCHRYETLKRNCRSFYGMRDFGLVFLPKSIRIDTEDLLPDMFDDGEVVNIPAEDAVRRRGYVWGGEEHEREEKDTLATEHVNEEQNAHEFEEKRENLRRLIANLSGILDTGCELSLVANADIEGECEAKIRAGWIWNVIQMRQEQNNFSKYRMQLWKALGKLCGVEPSVRFFTCLVRLLLKDFVRLAESNTDAAKESPKWLFSCISDILVAAIRISKRNSSAREEALKCYVETLMFVCTNWLVPHEVHGSFVLSVLELRGTMKTDEVWSVYAPLFEAVTVTNTNNTTKESAATNQDVSGVSNDNDNCKQNNTEVETKIGGFSLAGCTLAMVRVLSIIAQLLCVFAHEINIELLPKLCRQIIMRREALFCSTVMSIRYRAALVIQQIMRLCLHQSIYIRANRDVLSSVVKFLESLERLVELPALPALDTNLTLAPWSNTPAFGSTLQPFLQSSDVAACEPLPDLQIGSSLSFSEVFNLDSGVFGATTPSVGGLAVVKSFFAYWYQPPQPLLNARVLTIIPLFVRALDIQLQDVDNFYDLVQATLSSIVYIRLPKETIHNVLELLCEILEEKRPYGKTWQAKVILSQTLCFLLFINLHRIGKFAFIESVSRAALQSIGHGDGRVRKEGRQILAVLTKVASVEQIQAIIHSYFSELRKVSNAVATVSVVNNVSLSPHALQETMRRRRRSALLIALCSILSASPGVVPPYAPRLMERLGAFANDPAQEVQRAVKQAFGDWWRSHREVWELEHKAHFTAAQIEVIAPLMAPSYLV